MNEKQAEARGYHYTGIYSRNRDEIMARQDELKKERYKSVVVTVPRDPHSRGPGRSGYQLYVERRYIVHRQISELQNGLARYDSERRYIEKGFNDKIAELEERHAEMRDNLAKLLRES